ncbi:MAG: hypothetical protein ACRD2W_14675 [Acidimicrobiales bacterium]
MAQEGQWEGESDAVETVASSTSRRSNARRITFVAGVVLAASCLSALVIAGPGGHSSTVAAAGAPATTTTAVVPTTTVRGATTTVAAPTTTNPAPTTTTVSVTTVPARATFCGTIRQYLDLLVRIQGALTNPTVLRDLVSEAVEKAGLASSVAPSTAKSDATALEAFIAKYAAALDAANYDIAKLPSDLRVGLQGPEALQAVVRLQAKARDC